MRERAVAVAQAARDLVVHENLLRKGVMEFAADPGHASEGHGQMNLEQLEFDRVRREVAKLKAERDIKKSRRLLSGRPKMRLASIAKHRGIWPAAWICGALGVSRSGFHALLTRSPSQRARDDTVIGARVRASHVGTYRTNNASRVWLTCSPEASPVACIGSNGSSRSCGLDPIAVACPRSKENAQSLPATCWIASSPPEGPTRSGWLTSPTFGQPKDDSTEPL